VESVSRQSLRFFLKITDIMRPGLGQNVCGSFPFHALSAADNAEPFFKTLLKSVALHQRVAKRIGRKRLIARAHLIKRALVPS
jgi:hypothetical protein